MHCKCKTKSKHTIDYHPRKKRFYVFLNRKEMKAVNAKELKKCPNCNNCETSKVIQNEPHFLVSLNNKQLEKVKQLSGRKKGLKVRNGSKTFRSFNTIRTLQGLSRGRLAPAYRSFLKSGGAPRGSNPGIKFAQSKARSNLKTTGKQTYEDVCLRPFPPPYCLKNYKMANF